MKEKTYLIALVCDLSNINIEKKIISLRICISTFVHCYGKQKSLRIVETRKDMALSAISMNSALADKEFVLSLHHKLHVSTCINKPNDVHKHNQSILYSINQSFYINNNETFLRDETISRYLFKEGVL